MLSRMTFPKRLTTGHSWVCCLVSLYVASLVGCVGGGYQFGIASLYRNDVHTVHVPIFEYDGFHRGFAQQLTEAVIKEIESSTPYKVVSADRADTTLTGRITRFQKNLIFINEYSDVRDFELGTYAAVSWIDRRGDSVLMRGDIPLPSTLMNVSSSADVIPEAGQSSATGRQKIVHSVAQQIVAQMEAPW